MSCQEETKASVLKAAKLLSPTCAKLCIDIHDHPETAFEEHHACNLLTQYLAEHGFSVQTGCAGLETAFRAELDSGRPGPTIGLVCEYDALPGLGHACGHNIIGTASATAAIAASAALKNCGGKIVVLGTPAEEGGGGKVIMLHAGLFDDLDCAMMIHPCFRTVVIEPSLAINACKIQFHGKSAHAAARPWDGISALEAVLALFSNVNGLRAYLPADARLNGIITDGGKKTNTVPDFCEAEFSFRACSDQTLDMLSERLRACAEAAAISTGCTVDVLPIGEVYRGMKSNHVMAGLMEQNMRALNIPIDLVESPDALASTDMGNVSLAVPSIHSFINVGMNAIPHTPKFAEATAGEAGAAVANQAAQALALTAADILSQPDIVEQIRQEFNSNK